MIVSSSLVALKLVSALAKDMVNWEAARRVAPNLFYAGKEFILSSLSNQNEPGTRNQLQTNQVPSTEYLVHNLLEALFAWFQVVVFWHDPFISFCAISGLLTSFLLLTHFAPRFYATIMIAIFVYNLTKVWFRHVWPEIRVPPEEGRDEEQRLDIDRWTYLHPQLMTLAELKQLISNLMEASELYLTKLLELRREKPVTFCLLVCSTLSCTAYIGNKVSGSTLIFCFTTALVTAPGVYLHLLPKKAKDFIGQKISSTFFHNAQQQQQQRQNQEPESQMPEPSRALGLIEQLKRGSQSILRSDCVDSTVSQLAKEVPIKPNDEQQEINKEGKETKPVEKERHELLEKRQGSDSSSSGGSTSLIDFEEDTQDGFVIL